MSTTSVEPATPTSYVPSRRTVLRAAAWTAPAVSVAVAVPAYAACSPAAAVTASYLLDWGVTPYTFSAGASGTHVGTAQVAGTSGSSPINVTFTSTVAGQVNRLGGTNGNLRVDTVTTNIGGLGQSQRGLQLHHAQAVRSGRSNRQTVAVSFDRPVTGLRFTITDVDSAEDAWYDMVELTGSPNATVQTFRRGRRDVPYVEGAGTEADPWHYYLDDSTLGNSGSNRGNIAVSYPGPVSSFALTYWTTVGGGNQRIWLSDFSFSASSC